MGRLRSILAVTVLLLFAFLLPMRPALASDVEDVLVEEEDIDAGSGEDQPIDAIVEQDSASDVIKEQFYVGGTLFYAQGDHRPAEDVVSPEDDAFTNVTGHPFGMLHASPRLMGAVVRHGGAPGIVVSDVRHVIIDSSVANALGPSNSGNTVRSLEHWLDGGTNVLQIDGLDLLYTGNVRSLARAFAGCARLEELDLTSFDTSSCTNLAQMLEGCESLCELRLGEGWTQAGVGTETTDDDSGDLQFIVGVAVVGQAAVLDAFSYVPQSVPVDVGYATFPVPMYVEHDGQRFEYAAGDVIPDGPGVYMVANRTPVQSLRMSLSAQPGASHAGGGDTGLPLACEYTGSAIEPNAHVFADDGTELEEGVDYWVSYVRNVEVGEGEVAIHGMGSYYGYATAGFSIVDTAAYAFLYSDGTMVLKAGYEVPGTNLAPKQGSLVASLRWFDAQTARPGSVVVWADRAGKVRRVVVDKSFGSFSPVSMADWFRGCSSLVEVVGLRNINTARVTSMASLFEGCTALTDLDLAGLSSSAVTDFSGFARGCSRLERLELAGMDLRKATNTSGFLQGCSSLAELSTASGWRNATRSGVRLTPGRTAYRTEPSGSRLSATTALGDGAAVYRTRDLPMQFASVEVEAQTFVCTGKDIKPKIVVRLGSATLTAGTDYTVSFKNNRYPGNATATIAGKGIFSGAVTVPFRLKAGVTKGQRITYRTKKAVFTFTVTKVGKDGVTAEGTLVRVDVRSVKTASITIPDTCTVGNVKVTVRTIGKKVRGRFRNVSTVKIGSKVTRICARAFCRAPSVNTLVIRSKRLTKVKNCLLDSNIWDVQVAVRLSRSKQRKYYRWFTEYSGQYGVWYTYWY